MQKRGSVRWESGRLFSSHYTITEHYPYKIIYDRNFPKPTNAAILLFGVKPQKFMSTAEIKCMHYHGTVVAKPIPSHQIFTGTLFDQPDQATDFILSKINRIVPPRDSAPVSETRYEIPKEVIQEAVVNAVAHRDYTSAASVQVSVFSDRIEVQNPGCLPPDLTFEDLKIRHSSRPRNHRIALPLYLTHYIEKIGYQAGSQPHECNKITSNCGHFSFEYISNSFIF